MHSSLIARVKNECIYCAVLIMHISEAHHLCTVGLIVQQSKHGNYWQAQCPVKQAHKLKLYKVIWG